MAGLGFKDFQVGEVLTSSDVDGYLMQQTVMRFADAAARGSALGTAPGTAVALAEGMVSYLDDNNLAEIYNGTSWTTIGRIVQVATSTKTDVFTASVATGAVSGAAISTSITPTLSTHKILVIAQIAASAEGASACHLNLFRDASASTYRGDASSPRQRVVGSVPGGGVAGSGAYLGSVVYLDDASAATSTTYSIRLSHSSSVTRTVYLNRSADDTGNNQFPRGASSLTLIEVVA